MEITKENFLIASKAIFKGCKIPKRKPNFVSYSKYTGLVSSAYFYGEDKNGKFVIRVSDHWSTYKNFSKQPKKKGCDNIRSCFWELKTNSKEEIKAGKCYFKDFT